MYEIALRRLVLDLKCEIAAQRFLRAGRHLVALLRTHVWLLLEGISQSVGEIHTHDTPLPIGLFVPFLEAWKAVKEFMETEGHLPASIEWIKNSDVPEGTFPDPTVRLPGEEN